MRTTLVLTMALILTSLALAPVAAAAAFDAPSADSLDAPNCGTLAGVRCADNGKMCQVYFLGTCVGL